MEADNAAGDLAVIIAVRRRYAEHSFLGTGGCSRLLWSSCWASRSKSSAFDEVQLFWLDGIFDARRAFDVRRLSSHKLKTSRSLLTNTV